MGRKDAIALLLLALLFIVLFWPGFQGHFLVPRDMPGLTIPSHAFFRKAVLAGELPLWNPFVGIGFPTLAVPVHGSFYPGNLLLLVGSLATGMAVTWATHMWIAAAGGYALARGAGARPEAAAIAALVVGLGGYAVSMVWTGEKTLVLAWVPWVAWTFSRVAAKRTASRVVLAALPPTLLCAAGDPFILLDAVILAAPFVLAAIPAGCTRGESVREFALAFALPLALFALLAAPVLLPAAMLRGETVRAAALSKTAAEWWSLEPSRWTELFLSRPFGDPIDPWIDTRPDHVDDIQAVVSAWAVSLYIGVGTLGLAVAARGRLAKLLLLAAVVSVLLALGKYLPVHAWVVKLLPPLGLARYPEKHVVVASEALGVLAALGAERLLSRIAGYRLPLLVTLVGLTLAIALGPRWLGFPIHQGIVQSLVAVTVLIVAVALALRSPRFQMLPALAVAGDLLFSAWPLFPFLPSAGLPPSHMAEEVWAGARPPLPPRILRFSPEEPRSLANFPANAPILYGIASVDGEDSAVTPRLWAMVAYLVSKGRPLDALFRVSALIIPTWDPPIDNRPAWGIRHFDTVPQAAEDWTVKPAVGPQIANPMWHFRGSLTEKPPPGKRWTVQRRPDHPRAWLVSHVDFIEPEHDVDVDRVLADPFDVENEAVVAVEKLSPSLVQQLLPLAGRPPGSAGACKVLGYAFNHVEVSCNAREDSLLVLADGYSEGWHAEVDGAPSR